MMMPDIGKMCHFNVILAISLQGEILLPLSPILF
jgi:hypothetical protein